MTCGCQPVGFGASGNPLAGSLKCSVTVNGYTTWQMLAPGSLPPAGTASCYIADGNGNWYPYQAAQPPWNQTPTVNVSAANVNNLFKNFTESASQAWRQGSLVGQGVNAQSVGNTLNDMAIKVSPSVTFWQFTGPSQYAASLATLQGLAWALSHNWLVITKQGAVLLQSNDIQSGVVPASFWEMYGKPIAIMATVLAGAAIAGGASAAGGASTAGGAGAAGSAGATGGAVTAGGLAATPLPAASALPALAQPIAVGSFVPVSASGLATIGAVGGVGAGAAGTGIAGTASEIASAGGSVLKGAAVLQQLNALSGAKGGASPLSPSSPGASVQSARSSSALWLVLAAAGAGAFMFLT